MLSSDTATMPSALRPSTQVPGALAQTPFTITGSYLPVASMLAHTAPPTLLRLLISMSTGQERITPHWVGS